MKLDAAMEVIQQIQEDQGDGLLETLQYMDRNLFQFDSEQKAAFRVVMDEFGKLFAPA